MKRLVLLAFLAIACNRNESGGATAAEVAGDTSRGKMLISQYGCNVCHAIPGVEGPQGSLGPSLDGLASRPVISAARVPNTTANLMQFIQNPASLNPQSSMPPIGLAPGDAQDITAYLMTLK